MPAHMLATKNSHRPFLFFDPVFGFWCFSPLSIQVARLLETKGVGNITPVELKETLGSFGLEGEDAEDILVEVVLI